LSDTTVTVLLATEPNPPADEDPLDWVLLTNLAVETPEQAIEKLQWYLARWQIAVFSESSKAAATSKSCSWKNASDSNPHWPST
jgi:hypothetical protein